MGGDWDDVLERVWSMSVICSGVKELKSGVRFDSGADRGDMLLPAVS